VIVFVDQDVLRLLMVHAASMVLQVFVVREMGVAIPQGLHSAAPTRCLATADRLLLAAGTAAPSVVRLS
jgi:hypothetical protein